MLDDLPFVDEHAIVVDRPRPAAFANLERTVRANWARSHRRPIEHLLGTHDPGGFAVAASTPPDRLVLTGRHRFARYRLEFHLADAAGGTRIAARTYARFPGPHGQLYKTLVIRTRLHVAATRRILRSLAAVPE